MNSSIDMQNYHFDVTEKQNKLRLDTCISHFLPQYTRSYISRLIKTEAVHVNQHLKKASYLVKTGDCISILITEREQLSAIPEDIPLDILYEDQDILIINKQAGLVIHPAPGHASGTLVNALLHYNNQQFSKVDRFGIVHRLDQDTTGCLIVAKNMQSQNYLNQLFKNRTIEKKYLCLVNGQMKQQKGIIDLPIGRHPTHRKKMSVHAKISRHAETAWKLSRQFDHFALLEIFLKTGRTHQIRVHLAAINHPVVGDQVYGKQRNWEHCQQAVQVCIKKIHRQMLHAHEVGFMHPRTNKFLRITAPLPVDMADVLSVLDVPKLGN